MIDLDKQLQEIVNKNNILKNEPMNKHTTFRIGGNADMFVSPKINQVAEIMALAKEYEVPVTIVGNGSNLLVGDKGCGKRLVTSIISNKLKLEIKDISESINTETLDSIYICPTPYFYFINTEA